RIVLSLSIGHRRTDRQEYLDEARMIAESIDFARRHVGLLAWHDDRGAEPRLIAEPLGDDPVVDRARHRHVRVGVVDALHGIVAVEDSPFHVPWIENLLAEQAQTRPGRSP